MGVSSRPRASLARAAPFPLPCLGSARLDHKFSGVPMMTASDSPAQTGSDISDHLAQIGANLAARPYARRGIPTSNATIRVVLVDDHAMVREGLRVLLRNAHDIAVVGEAENGGMAVAVAQRVLPDIVGLGLDMP